MKVNLTSDVPLRRVQVNTARGCGCLVRFRFPLPQNNEKGAKKIQKIGRSFKGEESA